MHPPKVSIGLPVYNGEKYLREAITSILDQDFTDYELILADNASTDGTEAICREFAAKDARIRYYRNPENIGAGGNFRLTFSLARGEFFKWATYDDVHRPGCLRRLTEVLETAPEKVVLVAPRNEIIDEESALVKARSVEHLQTTRPTAHGRLSETMSRYALGVAQFGLYRTATLARTRLIDDFPHSDNVLLAELAMLGEIWEVDEILFARRYHLEVSTAINKTKTDFTLWFNPKAKGKALKRLLTFEYMRSALRMPPNPLEKALCLGVVVRHVLLKKFNKYFGDTNVST